MVSSIEAPGKFTKLVVGDLERSAAFYKSVCGLVEAMRIDGEIDGRPIREIAFEHGPQGGMRFVLLAFLDTNQPAAGEVIVGISTPDLDAFLDRVRAGGGEVTSEVFVRADHGVKIAHVKDPEGHMIEVVQAI
jgi:predicted enzyme related to lactoylglutathione lyase